MKMIIYMYLTIIIVFSILTGIITTIIEKKGLSTATHNSIVQKVAVPSKVVRVSENHENVTIPVIKPDSDLSKTMEVLEISDKLGVETKNVDSNYYSSEPVLLGIVDDEIL